ncbi:hypothetical protein [Methanoregula boonei]|jgi:hypothetical protein|uniref:hypothetical protein n=1 Tax=Methanoregula boonei TaxID=358766 RepID=UPI0012FBED3D|nr:hypothetical protein [Methanoregula boonei]
MAIKKKKAYKAPASPVVKESFSGRTGTGTPAPENLLDRVKAYFIPGKIAET